MAETQAEGGARPALVYFIDMDQLVEEAVEEALEYKEQGFRAIKMKIGLGDAKRDVRR